MRLISSLDRILKGVVQGIYPIVHVFFRRCLIDTLVLWRNDFEAKPPFCAAGFSDRRHPQIDGLHVKIEPLFPVAVFRQFALIEYNPESDALASDQDMLESLHTCAMLVY